MPQPRKKTAERGYGAAHEKLRKAWAPRVATGAVACARCRRRILPGMPWDLGHEDWDRTRYTGPEHASCNRAAGARKTNLIKRGRAPRQPIRSRQW